jgi:hypothetical protein
MGSKESLLRNKYKKTQPFQKSQLMFLSFNMLYIVINIYIYIYIYGIEGIREREEKEKERRRRREENLPPREKEDGGGTPGGSVGERWRRLDRWDMMFLFCCGEQGSDGGGGDLKG